MLGIFSAAMGIKGFLLPSQFIDGGVTGVSMLLNNVLGFPLSILIAVINLPFLILAYFQMGSRFAFRSCAAIVGLSLCVAFVPYPIVTPDKLLTALFGGFFLGLGIGLAIRGGAVLDGTEIAALLISKSSTILRVADVILIMNVIIFTTAAFFLGIERAAYSILTYFAASKTIDFLLYGLEEFTGVTIVSEKSEEIRHAIVEKLNRGVTIYSGKGGYGKRGEQLKDSEIIFTVVTRLEVGTLHTIINSIDPDAFIIQQSINNIQGGMMKKRALH